MDDDPPMPPELIDLALTISAAGGTEPARYIGCGALIARGQISVHNQQQMVEHLELEHHARYTSLNLPLGLNESRSLSAQIDYLNALIAPLITTESHTKSRTIQSQTPTIVRVPADFATISQAITAAKPFDLVLVQSGVYKERIVVTKSVDVVGTGDVVLEWTGEGSVVEFKGDQTSARLVDVTVSHRGADTEGFGAVMVHGAATVQIDRCKLSSLAGAGCYVQQQGSKLQMHGTAVSKCLLSGLNVSSQAVASLAVCTMRQNGLHGITVRDGGRLVVRQSVCEHNAQCGIIVAGPATALVDSCTAQSNQKDGITAHRGAIITAVHNRCTANERHGIFASEAATSGLIQDNKLEGNWKNSLKITESCAGTIRQSGNGPVVSRSQSPTKLSPVSRYRSPAPTESPILQGSRANTAAVGAAQKAAGIDQGGDSSSEELELLDEMPESGAPPSIRQSRKPKQQKATKNGKNKGTAHKDEICWGNADPCKWDHEECAFNGGFLSSTDPVIEKVVGAIAEGKQLCLNNPIKYEAVFFQTSMLTWPSKSQKYTLVQRAARANGLRVVAKADGKFTWCRNKYEVLNDDVALKKDTVSDKLLEGGYLKKRIGMVLPGRGQGCADVPGLRLVDPGGDVDPNDVFQEFDGSVAHLFRKTKNWEKLPHPDEPNLYTVTLHDLSVEGQANEVIDERLCTKAANSTALLGAHPSTGGELWVPYLEKAVAVHCGGWDKIKGGLCTHAWRILTGCNDQYIIKFVDAKPTKSGKPGKAGFRCYGKTNPRTKKLEKLANSPQDSFGGSWPSPWPLVGGGGGPGLVLTAAQVFEKMCAWDDENYIIGAGTKAGSDTHDHDGIVDGHAYSVLECENDIGGTEFDLVQVRNPWGKGEFTNGFWDDDGPGWNEYPQVLQALGDNGPDGLDNGIFWLSKEEFFEYFGTIYVCAHDMSQVTRTTNDCI